MIQNSIRFFKLILISCVMLLATACSDSTTCYEPDDLGTGGNFRISAEGKKNCNDDTCVKVLHDSPPERSIVEWQDSGFYTIGHKAKSLDSPIIKVAITGKVCPWGAVLDTPENLPNCTMTNCDITDANCMGTGVGGSDEHGVQIRNTAETDIPCNMRSHGLYIAFALPDTSTNITNSPNVIIKNNHSEVLPSTQFRTYHLGTDQLQPDGSYYKEITAMQFCRQEGDNYICEYDRNSLGDAIIKPNAKIHLKILDSYYGDNSGFYEVKFLSVCIKKLNS